MKLKLTEKQVQQACLDILKANKIFHWRNNTGATKTERGGFIRFGAVGSPDIIAVYGGQFIGIECKGTSKKQSKYQKQFQEDLENAGGWYWLIDDPDQLSGLLMQHFYCEYK